MLGGDSLFDVDIIWQRTFQPRTSFTVRHTPSHSICPLSYTHHGQLVSDTLTISFDFTSTYAYEA